MKKQNQARQKASAEAAAQPGENKGIKSGEMIPKAEGDAQAVRTFKIEQVGGDYWRKKTCPGIRLKGNWLHGVGFPAGSNVEVIPLSDGLLLLRETPTPYSKNPQLEYSMRKELRCGK